MTAALKPVEYRQLPAKRSAAQNRGAAITPFAKPVSSRRERLRLAQVQSPAVLPKTNSKVRTLPNPRALPSWLRLLLVAQRGSSLVTFLMVAFALTIYGLTVHTQQLWGKEYHRLEQAQKLERQRTAANEMLKNQIAQQAEDPSSGLVTPVPGNSIFLAPAPPRPAPAIATPATLPHPIVTGPVGY